VKLLIPSLGKPDPVDERLFRLATFLGVEAEFFPLAADALPPAPPVATAAIAVNPAVWSGIADPTAVAEWLKASGAQLLIHALRPETYASALVSLLSSGHIKGLAGLSDPSLGYHIASEASDVCGAYAGASFAPANSASDCVLTLSEHSAAEVLITAGGGPIFAKLEAAGSRAFFVATADVASLDAPAGDHWATEFFSRFVLHVMALRAIFSDACWRPVSQQAAIVIDDPLLRPRYGFLDFERLLTMTREHNFHAVLAFIPYNFRRVSDSTVRLFRDHRDRLSLCFHGNDHTSAEFASTAVSLLHTLLQTADRRIEELTRSTGLVCDRSMVFPQGRFSIEAMSALRAENFDAAVNTVSCPYGASIELSIGEMALPAVLRYGGFPLFLRRSSLDTQTPEIAFCLFFGRPVLIVEHHEIFDRPQPLLDAVHRINAAAPGIKWSPLSTAVAGAQLWRTSQDGLLQIRAWGRTASVTNPTSAPLRCIVEWVCPEASSTVTQVRLAGSGQVAFNANSGSMRVSLDLAPSETARLSVVHRSAVVPPVSLGLRHAARVYIRRRLSETRDNYLSRNPTILAAAKSVQRRLHVK
jgi:hypothetical protein